MPRKLSLDDATDIFNASLGRLLCMLQENTDCTADVAVRIFPKDDFGESGRLGNFTVISSTREGVATIDRQRDAIEKLVKCLHSHLSVAGDVDEAE